MAGDTDRGGGRLRTGPDRGGAGGADLRTSGPQAVSMAKALMARLGMVPVDTPLLDAAAEIGPARLRTLDAIHLSAAMSAHRGRELGDLLGELLLLLQV